MIIYLDVAIIEMGGLDHCKTWFNRPFPLDIPHYYQYQARTVTVIPTFPVVVSWFCLYCGLSYFDQPLSTFTLVFGNLLIPLYISAPLQIWPRYNVTLVCLYLNKCHSIWLSFAFLRSQFPRNLCSLGDMSMIFYLYWT